jgi:hypothetical protein
MEYHGPLGLLHFRRCQEMDVCVSLHNILLREMDVCVSIHSVQIKEKQMFAANCPHNSSKVSNWLQFANCGFTAFTASFATYLHPNSIPSPAIMVFTNVEALEFFTGADYLGLLHRTVLALTIEGINGPGDLADFDKDGLEQIYRNLRKPARILGPNGALQDVEPFVIGARSQMRITACALAIRYYEAIARDIAPDNMTWLVVQRFHDEWKAILDKKKMDAPVAPKMTKGMAVYKWLESLSNHLTQTIGVRNAPLAYIIRDEAIVNPVPPVLAVGEPFAEEYGSIEGEMIARLSHSHALYKSDNGQVFDIIESALRGTAISPSITQFRKTRDGRAAYMALKMQHAGQDVWDKINREAENKLQMAKWNGMTQITLQQHMSMHRREWISLQDCSAHIPVDVPNGRQRVTWLMNSITSVDPGILAALAAIRQDEADKRVNFESAVAYLAPVCPVAAKQQKKVKFEANISGTIAGGLGAIGKTGVALRYHKRVDFMKLREDQKKELKEWRASNSANGHGESGKKRKHSSGSNSGGNKKFKSMLAAISAENKEVIQALADSNSATVAAVAAGMESGSTNSTRVTVGAVTAVKPTNPPPAEMLLTAQVAALKLQGILKRDDSKDKKKSA